jgi:HK97 gp10 family phage protein
MANAPVKGLEAFNRTMDEFPDKFLRNVARGGFRAGMKPVLETSQQNAPVLTGALRDSLHIRTDVSGTEVVGMVRTRDWRAKFAEFGTRPHLISVREEEKPVNWRRSSRLGRLVRVSMTTINRIALKIGNRFVGRTVNHPGAQARPFLRPALDSRAQDALAAASEYMRNRLATREGLDTPDDDSGERR